MTNLFQLPFRWLIALAVVLVVSGFGLALDDRDYYYDNLRTKETK